MVKNENLNARKHSCVTVAADSGDSPSQQTPETSTVLWGGAAGPAPGAHSWKVTLVLCLLLFQQRVRKEVNTKNQ